jgi:hypothetical protein
VQRVAVEEELLDAAEAVGGVGSGKKIGGVRGGVGQGEVRDAVVDLGGEGGAGPEDVGQRRRIGEGFMGAMIRSVAAAGGVVPRIRVG